MEHDPTQKSVRTKGRLLERATAVASFATAVVLAFCSMLISPEHEIASGNLLACAQFLLFTASVFGLDYKLGTIGSSGSTKND